MRITLNPDKPATRTWSVQTCLERAPSPTSPAWSWAGERSIPHPSSCYSQEQSWEADQKSIHVHKSYVFKTGVTRIQKAAPEVAGGWGQQPQSMPALPSTGRRWGQQPQSMLALPSTGRRTASWEQTDMEQMPSGSFGGSVSVKTKLAQLDLDVRTYTVMGSD